uniref:ORF3 n=1 Tax=Chimpanzee anellovirus TaxID=1743410 RepID=A0A0S2GMI5_9VIRU|nr:ORF3 [Chimpanzee anellovirus]
MTLLNNHSIRYPITSYKQLRYRVQKHPSKATYTASTKDVEQLQKELQNASKNTLTPKSLYSQMEDKLLSTLKSTKQQKHSKHNRTRHRTRKKKRRHYSSSSNTTEESKSSSETEYSD